jgi:hypothetical protein
MFFDLFHEHYWGPPRWQQNGYYMTCYECGKQYKLKIDFDSQTGEVFIERHATKRQDEGKQTA